MDDRAEERQVGSGCVHIPMVVAEDAPSVIAMATIISTRPVDWAPTARAILWPHLLRSVRRT